MVHAGPLHTPSMNPSGTMASFWAAMSVAGSDRACATTDGGSAAVIVKSASVASRCLTMSVLLEGGNRIVPSGIGGSLAILYYPSPSEGQNPQVLHCIRPHRRER